MNIVSEKLLSDLEIDNKVIPYTNFTITSYGKTKFKELFGITYHNEQNLIRRRQIIEQIINYPKNTKKIINELKKIKKYEHSVIWLFNAIGKEYKDLYFAKDFMNTQDLLSAKNYLKIYMPSLIILVYLITYIVLKYNGISIDFGTYIMSIYESYKMMIMGLLTLFMDNFNFISLLTNMFATLYVLYQLYSIYNSCDSSISHYYKCNDFNEHITNIRNLIDSTKKIYKLDKFLVHEKKLLLNNINEIDEIFSDDKLSKFGYKLLKKKQVVEYESIFNTLLQYVGLVDSFINISKLVTHYGYTFPQFDFDKSKGPYIDATNMWNPYVNRYEQIKNDCNMGNINPNTIILTGPNTSGKSTFIRNIMLAVFLSQTIGVTCCDNLRFTPFNHLFTYLDIPNISRNRESLFESEVLRCMEYCNIIENINPNEYTFTIMDELLTSTNPQESMATSYAFCEFFGSFKNSLNVITTHHIELTGLEKLHPDEFKNMKFNIIKNQDGTFYRSYKINEGISNQCMAIEILKEKGYNSIIIDKAIDKINQIKQN